MRRAASVVAAGVLCAVCAQAQTPGSAAGGSAAGGNAAPGAGRITGVGGVFVTSPDPKALRAWYRDVLGVPLEVWGGAKMKTAAPGAPPASLWMAFKSGDSYLAGGTKDVMIDFCVDDLDAVLARLKAKGVVPLSREDADPNGRFAWVLDPDGRKIELWEPKR